MTTYPPTPSETDDEVTRLRSREAALRARVTELEAERRQRIAYDDTGSIRNEDRRYERARDRASRGGDELSRLVRGLILGSLEAVRVTASAFDNAVGRVYDNNRPEEDDDVRHLVGKLPGDVADALLDGVDDAFDAPSRAVDKLHDTYHEGQATRRRNRTRRTRPTDVESDTQQEARRIRQVLGRPVTRVILDAQDQVILNVGDVITNKAVLQARAAGVLDMLLDSASMKDPTASGQ